MIVYHGTTEKNWRAIAENGILPRGNRKGNWKHTVDSNPYLVYMTTVYAGYYAFAATEDFETERLLLVEIETDALDESRLRPDEDFIAQVIQNQNGDKATKQDLLDVTKMVRDDPDRFKNFWQDSLMHMGNISYKGHIPLSAIRRMAFVKFHPFFISVVDPTITIMNYKICKAKYQVMTRIMMGEDVPWEEYCRESILYGAEAPGIEIPDEVREQYEKAMAQVKEGISIVKIKGGYTCH